MNPVDFLNIVLYKGYLHAAVGWHFLNFLNLFATLCGRLDGKVVRLDKRWTQNGPRLDGGWLVPVRFFLLLFAFFSQICWLCLHGMALRAVCSLTAKHNNLLSLVCIAVGGLDVDEFYSCAQMTYMHACSGIS